MAGAGGCAFGGITENIKNQKSAGFARFALLRASPAGGKEGSLFCVFTARLKPCPDTCMVDGHNIVEHAKWKTSVRA